MDLYRYQQIKTSPVYSIQKNIALLHISGADQINFLQRQSTNDLNLLSAGHFIKTVLTSATARIVDVLLVFPEPDGQTLSVMSLPGRAGRLEKYLRSRIFFMDKVAVERDEEQKIQITFHGKTAAAKLQETGLAEATNLQPGEFTRMQFASYQAVLLRDNIQPDDLLLLLPAAGEVSARRWLEENGYILLSSDERELLRVEAGLPGELNELTEEYSPLETGLQSLISGNKGCYTGQEIIARQITYDKVTRRLSGLRLAVQVQPGSTILVEEKPAGVVTSTAVSPAFGDIALAMLKRPYFENGTPVFVQSDGEMVSGYVTSLPFH